MVEIFIWIENYIVIGGRGIPGSFNQSIVTICGEI